LFDAVNSPKPNREVRIDALRGLFLVLMAVNHVPSELHPWTDHSLGFFSSAEGFFFLSGLLAGRVYTRRWERDGAAVARRAAWRRAGAIYLAQGLTLAVVFTWTLAWHGATGTLPGHASPIIAERPLFAAGAALVLGLQPALFDILPIYAAFMLLLPGLLAIYARGWQALVLAASVGIWLAGYFWRGPIMPDELATHAFPWAAWQLPLVVGSVCGNLWARGRTEFFAVRTPVVIGAGLICAGCFLIRHAYVPPPVPIPLLESLSSKNFLGPLRVLNVAAAFYLILCAATRWAGFMRVPPLAFLGRHTLPVFCAHIVAAYGIYAFPATFDSGADARWLSTFTILGVMFAAAALHAAWQKSARS